MRPLLSSIRPFSLKSGIFAILMSAHFFTSAWAAATDLLAQPERPTIRDVLAIPREEIAAMPLVRGASLDPRVQKVLSEGPRLIAELEYAFSGATWAPLGRDSAVLADVLEAFYLARGEPNRVIRLNASGNSFVGGNWELGFLTSNGLALGASGRPVHPFVILDATSWGGTLDQATSQSRRLVGSVYEKTPENFRAALLHHLNAIAQGPATNGSLNGNRIAPGLDPGNFLREVPIGAAGPAQILYVTDAFAYGHWDWHGPFEPFERQADGRVAAAPGALSPEPMRAGILKSMLAIAALVQSEDFQERTRHAARELGFDFEWLTRHRVWLDDRLFTPWSASERWTLAKLDALQATTHGMPKGFASRFNERWWELTRQGIESGAIQPQEFETLAEQMAARAANDPSLSANLGWQFSQKTLTARLAAFKDVLFSPRQEKLSDDRRSFLVEVFALQPDLVSAAVKHVVNLRALVQKGKIHDLRPNARVNAMKALLPLAKSPQDFLDLVAYDVRNVSSGVHYIMDAFIVQNLQRFQELGASPAQLIQLQATHMGSYSNRKIVQAAAFARVEDFAELVSLGAVSGDGIIDSSFVDAVLRHGKDRTATELIEIVQKVAIDYRGKESILRLAFSRTTTPAEFFLVASYDKVGATFGVNWSMDELIAEFFPHLLKIGGTIEDILNVENHLLYGEGMKQHIHNVAIQHVTDVNARLKLFYGFTAKPISMKAIDAFLSNSESVPAKELKQLSLLSTVPIEGAEKLRARALQKASTVEEFLEVASYHKSGVPSRFGHAMDDMISSNLRRFIELGATVEDVINLRDNYLYASNMKHIMNRAIERAKTTGSLLPPEKGLKRAWGYVKGFWGRDQNRTSRALPPRPPAITSPPATGRTQETTYVETSSPKTTIHQCSAALMKDK